MTIASDYLFGLSPENFVEVDLASESLRQNFREIFPDWSTRRPFYVMQSGSPQVVISRYRDMKEVLTDTTRFTGKIQHNGEFNFAKFLPTKLMNVTSPPEMDGEDHARIRRLINPAFSPKSLANHLEMIKHSISRLVDNLRIIGPEVDIMSSLAEKLMPEILLRNIFGLDENQSECFVSMNQAVKLTAKILPGQEFPDEYKKIFELAENAINQLISNRRASSNNDFINHLIQASDQGSALSDKELFDLIFNFCVGGIDTTTTTLGGSLFTLLQHKDAFQKVAKDLSLLPQSLEEAMRYHSAGIFLFTRYSTSDTYIDGIFIPKGIPIVICHQAAAFDPNEYQQPEIFDIDRKPRNVPIFGLGSHVCPGSRLSRIVLLETLEQLIINFPEMKIADGNFIPVYGGEMGELQLKELPVKLW